MNDQIRSISNQSYLLESDQKRIERKNFDMQEKKVYEKENSISLVRMRKSISTQKFKTIF